jgi:hypothetical protein
LKANWRRKDFDDVPMCRCVPIAIGMRMCGCLPDPKGRVPMMGK